MNETPEPKTVRPVKSALTTGTDGVTPDHSASDTDFENKPVFQAFCDCFPPLIEVLLDLIGVVSVFNCCLL